MVCKGLHGFVHCAVASGLYAPMLSLVTDTSLIRFDFAEIARRIRLVADYDKIWHEFFARSKLRVAVLIDH